MDSYVSTRFHFLRRLVKFQHIPGLREGLNSCVFPTVAPQVTRMRGTKKHRGVVKIRGAQRLVEGLVFAPG